MKIKEKVVHVRLRDGATTLLMRVPAWEVPLLEAVHEGVEMRGDAVREWENRSVSAEYERLAARYGFERSADGAKGTTVVAAVYGSHGAGQQALRRAMQDSVLPPETPVTPEQPSDPIRQDLLDAISDTPTELTDMIGEPAAEAESLTA